MEIDVSISSQNFPFDIQDQRVQQAIVQYVRDCWDVGERERKKYASDWRRCQNAYELRHEEVVEQGAEWRSQVYYPWVQDAVDNWCAFQMSVLFPDKDPGFSIEGKTNSDKKACEAVQKKIESDYNQFHSYTALESAIRQTALTGSFLIKQVWRHKIHQDYPFVQAANGEYVRTPRERVVHNGVSLEFVDLNDFVFFPLHGTFQETTQIERTWCYKSDLEPLAESHGYFNLDKLKDDSDIERYHFSPSPTRHEARKEASRRRGIQIKEAWIHRLVLKLDGRQHVVNNVIAEVAEDETLIRFRMNPYPDGETIYKYCLVNPNGTCLYSRGIVSGALPLQNYGNFLSNARNDSIKVTVYPQYKYLTSDGSFNPHLFIAEPGGLIGVDSMDSLQPIVPDVTGLNISMEELGRVKAEFEDVTVPRVVKGDIESGAKTATEIEYTQINSSSRLGRHAIRISNGALKALMSHAVQLVREVALSDQSVMRKIASLVLDETEMSDLEIYSLQQQIAGLEDVDIKVTGYLGFVDKIRAVQSLRGFLTEVAQSPAATYVKWLDAVREAGRLEGIDVDLVMMNEQEAAQVQQRQAEEQRLQGQALLALEQQNQVREQQKVDLDAMKIQLDVLKTELDAKLKVMELVVKNDASPEDASQAKASDISNVDYPVAV